jgi:Ni/Co efflux regulator RcnB
MPAPVKRLLLIVMLALSCAPALAQRQQDWKAGKNQGTTRDDRERMRQDMRDAYRDRGGERDRQERRQQLTPQERDKLRRDIEDANRGLKR